MTSISCHYDLHQQHIKLDDLERQNDMNHLEKKVTGEIDLYQNTIIPCSMSRTDPLLWWKYQSMSFPGLPSFARNTLYVMATITPR